MLFVYGSLLDAEHREQVLGRHVETMPATLRGYERGRTRHYFLRKQSGSETPGFLLMEMTARDFAILDGYEEVPVLYTRERVEVIDSRGQVVACWVYLPTPHLFTVR